MDDVKTTNANDTIAAKTIALDHLGVIAARLRTIALKFSDDATRLLPLDEVFAWIKCTKASSHFLQILTNCNTKAFSALSTAHHAVDAHVCRRSSEDQACAVSYLIWLLFSINHFYALRRAPES